MKLLVNIALIIATVSAAASSQCMYCRRLDEGAGLLVTFSYCNQTDICLQNAWNYITRECNGGWVRGSSYELDFCQPDEISCPEYVSTPDKYQVYDNKTWSLSQGGMCKVKIDASEHIGWSPRKSGRKQRLSQLRTIYLQALHVGFFVHFFIPLV